MKKNILFSIIVLIFACLSVSICVYAWITNDIKSIVIKTSGDISMEVEGYAFEYGIEKDSEVLLYSSKLGKYMIDDSITISDISSNKFLKIAFVVHNTGEKDCLVKGKFSNFFDYMFDDYEELEDTDNISNDTIKKIVLYNGKLVLYLSEVYYSFENIITKPDTMYELIEATDRQDVNIINNGYFWTYSRQNPFCSDIELDKDESVTIVLTIKSNQSSEAIQAYRSSVLDQGRNYIALKNYNIPYNGITEQDTINYINRYIEKYYLAEIDSINQADDTGVELKLDYIEFVSERIPNIE